MFCKLHVHLLLLNDGNNQLKVIVQMFSNGTGRDIMYYKYPNMQLSDSKPLGHILPLWLMASFLKRISIKYFKSTYAYIAMLVKVLWINYKEANLLNQSVFHLFSFRCSFRRHFDNSVFNKQLFSLRYGNSVVGCQEEHACVVKENQPEM